jgi:transcriptional regulator with XRE-family HTH domain
MAMRLGLHYNTLNRYENGSRKIPRVLEIAARCIANHREG